MTYQRPPLNLGEYLDESGAPIPYGRRWGMGSPPDDTYSVTRHPERFAPLLDVARALREFLVATYDVDVDGDRIVPRDPNAAPLTIAETDFPYARVEAGVTAYQGAFSCGCDACDDDVEEIAEQLERFAFAVVGGRFQEFKEGAGVRCEWHDDEGSQSSWSRSGDKNEGRALKARGKGFVYGPWPLREEAPA